MTSAQQQSFDEITKTVDRHHEQQQYVRGPRTIHENLGHQRKRERADSLNTINEVFLRPARAPTGPVFSSATYSSNSGGLLPRHTARTSSLETPVYPSPKPLIPTTPNHTYSDCAVQEDEDINFIPLLDSSGGGKTGAIAGPIANSSKGDGGGGGGGGTPPAPRSIEQADDTTPRVKDPLLPMSFGDYELMNFLRESEFQGETAKLLEEAIRRRADLDSSPSFRSNSFRDFAAYEKEGYASATFEVYDVAADASVKKVNKDVNDIMVRDESAKFPGEVTYTAKYPGEKPNESHNSNNNNNNHHTTDAPMVWDVIKDVNPNHQSVGRITIVQEPTPLILAALQLTMSAHFDMSELLHHFLSDKPSRGRSHECMHHRAFERDPYPYPQRTPLLRPSAPLPGGGGGDCLFSSIRQRSFFFVFKYYTVVGDGLEPASWQRYDKRPVDERLGDHIDIAECGSVLALSLVGEPTKRVRVRPRREPVKEGVLFDTFGPWHLLSIQSFPDDQHTVRGEEFADKSFYNGPYAFLDLLIAEYRDAGKRNQILHERITKLITPPYEFMFDRRLRDKLLFEDKHFTYIRRYFWAYNTLAVINTGIKAMVAAYVDTFNDDFWNGTHPLIWPCPSEFSPEAAESYRDKMGLLRRELDKVVSELGEVFKRNERTRKEIENLRDQLFSGSSIKESRRAIDQGDNIRILTMISMLFLPLTFVTSVFGITELHITPDDWRFSITMVLVCIPFMVLVFLLQTRSFTRMLRRASTWLMPLLALPQALIAKWRGSPEPADEWSTAHNAGRRQRQMGNMDEGPKRWRWPWDAKSVDDDNDSTRV